MDEIPEGLDDLLNSIRGKGKSQQSSALAIVPKKVKQEEKLVAEKVDERIIDLLGIGSINDIDYATYKTLLREKMAEARMANSQIPTEETELLTNEFKRVKSSKGRFKVKERKVNTGSFFKTAQQKAQTAPQQRERGGALARTPMFEQQGPTSQIVNSLEEEQEKDDKSDQFIRNVLAPSLSKIEENLNAILETVTKQFKFEKKQSEKEADTAQNVRKKEREDKRETKVKSGVKDVADKVVKPVKGIFDMIMDFFKNILLGGALVWILNFIKDPAAAIQPLIDGINAIISFLNTIITNVFNAIFGPINVAIQAIYDGLDDIENALNSAIAAIPFGTNIPGYPFNNIDPSKAPQLTAPQIPPIQNPFGQPGGGQQQQTPVQGQAQGGTVINAGDIAFTLGGMIKPNSGVNITGMGRDTQLIAAEPGEIMMNRPAVQMLGAGNLLAANAAAGGSGSNTPKMGSIMGFQRGGMTFDPNDPLGSFMRINQGLKQPLPGVQPSVMFQSPLLQTPAASSFQPTSSVIPSSPKATINQISGADFDVILPLDHTKKPGTIPDTPGGSTFKNSNATGADGREREHQDKAAALIGQKLTAMGLRVKIMTPEEYPSYQDYDKALVNFASKGIKIVPLHFDAKGSVGFMTRTKAGDAGDARLASPIQQALVNFQKANPELGSIGSDTASNATINRAAATDAALVELGVMVDWEKKYGKDFTSTTKFDELATSISSAIFKGGGFGTPPVPGSVTTAPLATPQESSTTLQSSPTGTLSISPSGQLTAPGLPVPSQTNVIFGPNMSQQTSNDGVTSAAMASQKKLPAISPIDSGNNEFIVIKSIYNIVG